MQIGYEVFHRDIPALVDFYVNVLGFQASEGAMSSDHVVVRRGELRVGCSRHEGADPTPRKPPAGSEIVLRADDVHAEHNRVVSSGWPLADPLETRPWGLTDFRVFDPSGQYLRITNTKAGAEHLDAP